MNIEDLKVCTFCNTLIVSKDDICDNCQGMIEEQTTNSTFEMNNERFADSAVDRLYWVNKEETDGLS